MSVGQERPLEDSSPLFQACFSLAEGCGTLESRFWYQISASWFQAICLSGHKCLSVNLYQVWTLLPAPSKRRKTHTLIKSNSWEDWQSFYWTILARIAAIPTSAVCWLSAAVDVTLEEFGLVVQSVKKRNCSNTGVLVQLSLQVNADWDSLRQMVYCFVFYLRPDRTPTGNKEMKTGLCKFNHCHSANAAILMNKQYNISMTQIC